MSINKFENSSQDGFFAKSGSTPGGPHQGPPGGMPKAGPLKVHQLTPIIYWAEGGIGNCGFIIGEKGVIVIDATISPETGKELLEYIAKITPKPVTTVILTHGDIDHIGGLAAFPSGLTIFAHENTKKNLEAAVAAGQRMVSADHLPNRGVAKDREVVEIEGLKFVLHHWAPAHTDGDLVIYLPEPKIAFTGDIFSMNQPVALIHRGQHGSSEGWITSANGITALNADRFVVGHGQVQTRESLLARTQKAEIERAKIKEMVGRGASLEQIQIEVNDPPQGQDKQGPGGPRFSPFSEVVFQELTGKQT